MPEPNICPNCGTPAPAQFCPHCGQQQIDRRITLRHVVTDFIDDQFGLNQKAFVTFRELIVHPGTLTNEYFAGRIQRYIPPFKLYLLTSVFFFVLISLFTRTNDSIGISSEIHQAQDSVRKYNARTQSRQSTAPFFGVTMHGRETDNWLRDVDVNLGSATLNRLVTERLHRLSLLGEAEGTRRLVRGFVDQAPRVVFILLPVYALLLYGFYWRQRRYYVEHFVFALHFHAFAFLVLLPLILVDVDIIGKALMAWLLLYALIAQKRFYQQSYAMIVVKYFFLWILYWMVFAVGVLLALLFALAMV